MLLPGRASRAEFILSGLFVQKGELVWSIAHDRYCGKLCGARAEIDKLAPHDLRHALGFATWRAGKLDQIQFLLGHVSTACWPHSF
jgi:integrase